MFSSSRVTSGNITIVTTPLACDACSALIVFYIMRKHALTVIDIVKVSVDTIEDNISEVVNKNGDKLKNIDVAKAIWLMLQAQFGQKFYG